MRFQSSHTSHENVWFLRNESPEPQSIPLRNWIFLLIPSPIPELELAWPSPYGIELELSSFELESELHFTDSELPSMELISDMRSLIYQWPTTVLATQRRLTPGCLHITGSN